MADNENLDHYLSALHKMAEVPVDHSKPIRLYIRSAESVYKQACIYRTEQDLEKAFILFLKYSNLVLKELPKHPDYGNNITRTALLRVNLLTALDVLEAAKPILLKRYSDMEAEKARIAKREREFAEARKRESEARILAEKTAKSQEEARKQRLIEMQKLDLQKTYISHTLLDKSRGGEIGIAEEKSTLSPMVAAPTLSALYAPPVVRPTPIPSPKALCTQSFYDPLIHLDYLENGMPLRSINIPSAVVPRFLELATHNTKKNLETCGVLAGKLAHDSFTITTLIIPKQNSTSDTVTMLNEEEIFDVQDRKELLTLGWIHTHPTQQCFMSSVDLHTHFPYQLLIAEAIAIVVAPTQTPKLTDPPGIGVISTCPQRGFHQHPSDTSIYREISGTDGHAKFSSQLSLETIDLRNK